MLRAFAAGALSAVRVGSADGPALGSAGSGAGTPFSPRRRAPIDAVTVRDTEAVLDGDFVLVADFDCDTEGVSVSVRPDVFVADVEPDTVRVDDDVGEWLGDAVDVFDDDDEAESVDVRKGVELTDGDTETVDDTDVDALMPDDFVTVDETDADLEKDGDDEPVKLRRGVRERLTVTDADPDVRAEGVAESVILAEAVADAQLDTERDALCVKDCEELPVYVDEYDDEAEAEGSFVCEVDNSGDEDERLDAPLALEAEAMPDSDCVSDGEYDADAERERLTVNEADRDEVEDLEGCGEAVTEFVKDDEAVPEVEDLVDRVPELDGETDAVLV